MDLCEMRDGCNGEEQRHRNRRANFIEHEVPEIIAHVALNVLTNYFNLATDVDIDFRRSPTSKLPERR
jgi:hypothetical protein